jgi:type II secretory pathway pseudopilin PulG
MVVITIIGLMATVILAALASGRAAARDATRLSAAKEIQKALELYRNANAGSYPCATAMPGCINGGAGLAINGSTRNTFFDSAFSPYYKAVNESVNFAAGWLTIGSIQYQTGGTTAAPITNSYTLLIRREQTTIITGGATLPAGAFCAIRVGPNPNTIDWPISTYPNCF